MRIFTLFFFVIPVLAQTQISNGPQSPNIMGASSVIIVKPSTDSDALDSAAKDLQADQQAIDTAVQQERESLDASLKALQKQNGDLLKELEAQLRADKKYKPMMDKIDTIEKQIQTIGQTAQNNFARTAGPIQTRIASDRTIISFLVARVRKENNLPDSAIYDPKTQTWK